MDFWDCRIDVETKWEWNFGWFLWGSGAATYRPDQSVSLFAASRHFDIGEEAFFLFGWDLVVSDMACHSRAVVVAVAFNVPPCAHLDLSVPDWPFVKELFAESVFPQFACCHFEILLLC